MDIQSILQQSTLGIVSCGFLLSSFDPASFDEQFEYNHSFSRADYDGFDRDFAYSGNKCQVGIKAKKICFKPSPFEDKIVVGSELPRFAPAMPVTIPVAIRTTLKAPDLRTYRYGRTLVLVDKDSGLVADSLNLLSQKRQFAGENNTDAFAGRYSQR